MTETQNLPPPYDRIASLISNGADAQTSRMLRGALLEHALRFAKSAAPFYAHRIPEALFGLASAEAWQRVPLLMKEELRANDGTIKVATPPPFAGPTRSAWTSGSTGSPLNCHISALADHMSALVLQRFYRWRSIDPAKDLIHITIDKTGFQERPKVITRQGWYPADPRGKYHHLTISAGIDEQLDAIVERRPAYLKTFATHLGALAARAKERSLDIALEIAFSGGSPLPPDERALAAEAFRCRVADIYGSEELGIIAVDCPDCGAYHAAIENMHVEVLREDGSLAQPGETGRIVATAFLNFAMPLIRYELGDYVELAQTDCPNGQMSFRRIIGRRKSIFTLSNGQKFLPYVALGEIAKLGPVARFRFVQTSLTTVEFRYALRGPGAIDIPMLNEVSRKYLSPLLSVTAVPMPESDNDPARKFLVFESSI